MPTGSPILASAAGLVHEQFAPGGIAIDHGNGWFTVYLHMRSHVAPGTRVQRGQQIGIMGKVGTSATHLHYEQLYHAGGHDADNADIVNPVLQGRGPIVMNPNAPITMTSTNCGGGTAPPPPPPPSGAARYYVNTFAAAPGLRTPGGVRTGNAEQGHELRLLQGQRAGGSRRWRFQPLVAEDRPRRRPREPVGLRLLSRRTGQRRGQGPQRRRDPRLLTGAARPRRRRGRLLPPGRAVQPFQSREELVGQTSRSDVIRAPARGAVDGGRRGGSVRGRDAERDPLSRP